MWRFLFIYLFMYSCIYVFAYDKDTTFSPSFLDSLLYLEFITSMFLSVYLNIHSTCI